jgi:hypothetical protein
MARGRGMGWVLAAVVAAAVLVTGTSLAMAGSGTLSACVHRHGGGLYEARTCAKGDTRLEWGSTGPRGLRGAPGAKGTTGAQGAAGA